MQRAAAMGHRWQGACLKEPEHGDGGEEVVADLGKGPLLGARQLEGEHLPGSIDQAHVAHAGGLLCLPRHPAHAQPPLGMLGACSVKVVHVSRPSIAQAGWSKHSTHLDACND